MTSSDTDRPSGNSMVIGEPSFAVPLHGSLPSQDGATLHPASIGVVWHTARRTCSLITFVAGLILARAPLRLSHDALPPARRSVVSPPEETPEVTPTFILLTAEVR